MSTEAREEPDPEFLATRAERLSAWKALSEPDRKWLIAYAGRLARRYQFADPGMTWEDLMQATYAKVFDDSRTWNVKAVSFRKFMAGVLRSIAGDLARTNAGRVRAGSGIMEEGAWEPIEHNDPLTLLEGMETDAWAQAHIAALQVEFQDDEGPFYVLECLREGLKPREIKERLNMGDKQFDAARNKIARRSLKLRNAN
jgi:DNA-directed RNA polymerase specialized sigma24 family protein